MHKVAAIIGNDTALVNLTTTFNNQYLYTVNAGHGTISMFKINQTNGALTALGEISSLPANGSAVGIAAY